KEAARDSRCAVAILCPSYFQSEPCLAEFETFRRRGPGLLVPVRFHDCDDWVKRPENPTAFDLGEFTSTARGTARWDLFHDRVKCLAGWVAQAVVKAPPYPVDGRFPSSW